MQIVHVNKYVPLPSAVKYRSVSIHDRSCCGNPSSELCSNVSVHLVRDTMIPEVEVLQQQQLVPDTGTT